MSGEHLIKLAGRQIDRRKRFQPPGGNVYRLIGSFTVAVSVDSLGVTAMMPAGRFR